MPACTTLPLISFVTSTEYDTHASSSSYDTHASFSSYDMHASSSSYDMHASLIASTEAVAERVCGGERLTRPGECPDALWALLQRIWAERPADRPTIVEVAEALVVLSSACPEASALRRTTELAIPEHAMRLQRELQVEGARGGRAEV